MTATRAAAAALIGCLALATGGCGSADHSGSNTPRFTVDPTPSSSLLLTVDDVRAVAGFGDVEAKEINDVPLFNNPDPRGPCGGIVPSLPSAGAIGRVFSGSSAQFVELVVPNDPTKAEYLKVVQADRHEGCAPFQSMTNIGTFQTVSDIAFVELDDLGVPAIAWTSAIQSGSNSGFAGVFVIQTDTFQAYLQMNSLSPVAASTVKALAEGSLRRITG